MIYNTRNGQSIFDLVINTTNDLDSLYSLIVSNPIIKNIESVPVSVEIEYTPTRANPPQVNSVVPQINPASQNFYSKNNQTIFDVTMQCYGILDRVYKLIVDSNFTNTTTYPLPNTLFIFNPQLVHDNSYANYLSKKGIIINTGSANNSNSLQTDDGIDIATDGGQTIIID